MSHHCRQANIFSSHSEALPKESPLCLGEFRMKPKEFKAMVLNSLGFTEQNFGFQRRDAFATLCMTAIKTLLRY